MTDEQAMSGSATGASNTDVKSSVPAAPGDRLAGFALTLSALPSNHHRRIALTLSQFGMLITVACLPVSIAGMNIGLTTALVGAVVARAPLHRCVGAWCYLAYLVWLTLWFAVTGGAPKELVGPLVLPLGLVLGQVTFHPRLPGASLLRGWAVRALVVTIVASCVLALVQFTVGKGGEKPWRVDPHGLRFFHSTGFFSIQLTQGVMAGMVCLLIGGMAAGMGGWWRGIGQAAAAVAVAVCGARAALLGFVLGVAGSIAARGRRHLLLAVVVGVVLLAVVLGMIALTQRQRFNDLMAMRDGRWPIWRTSVAVIAAHPVFGTGGGEKFREVFRETYPQVVLNTPPEFPAGAPHAHNTVLAFAAEHGIPFALIWLALMVVAVVGLWRAPPEIWRAGLGMAIVALVFGQFEKFDGESSRVLWTGLGILLALRHATDPGADASVRRPQDATADGSPTTPGA